MHTSLKKIHILAVGGIGMSALARLFLQKGLAISGSDKVYSPIVQELEKAGMHWIEESAPLEGDCDAVFYSSDIKDSHPQFLEAKKRGIPLYHRSIGLKKAMEGKKPILIAGTHGKTTTTALCVHILQALGCDPSFAIGGHPSNGNAHAYWGKGEFFVAEADESDGSFLNYEAEGMIITNIDDDHRQYWKTMEALKKGFLEFSHKVKNKAACVVCLDDPLIASLPFMGSSYGMSPKADYQMLQDQPVPNGRQMLWQDLEGERYEALISLNGHHNALNALGVWAVLGCLGLDKHKMLPLFATFQGVGRRCQIKGTVEGTLWIDDYGHHPAEIKTTLRGIRDRYRPKSLAVIFQPHRFSRTADLWKEFYTAFEQVDRLIVTDIYGSNENNPLNLHAKDLAILMSQQLSREVFYRPRHELKHVLFNEELVITFGAGDVTRLYEERGYL